MRVFKETQRFNQWWLQLILLGLGAFLVYCLYVLLILKESVGNVEASNKTGMLILVGIIIPTMLLFVFMRMVTEINEVGIHYQFYPFHFSRKIIRWSEIAECYTRTYSPIKEYGGWGLRSGSGKNRAYNVKGDNGIQMVLKTKEKILIGTQEALKAESVIRRYLKKEYE